MSAVLWAEARAGQERRLAELVGLPAGGVPHPAVWGSGSNRTESSIQRQR